MDESIRAFITFLESEQRASPETVRNYASDLRQLDRFLVSSRLASSPVDPASLSSDAVRAYLEWLDRKGESRRHWRENWPRSEASIATSAVGVSRATIPSKPYGLPNYHGLFHVC